ncbi:MAG: translation initiation factor IF-2, partial [Muribaculaceae bacterium]|nr:translation initiation factor IF-2 [Muribaculaceae bacterium]
FEFLKKQNIPVEEHPNARVEDDVVRLLMAEFQPDKDLKYKSSQITSDRKKDTSRSVQRPSGGEEFRMASEGHAKPKILGTLQFDANGRPIVTKPAEKTPEKPGVSPDVSAPVVKAPEVKETVPAPKPLKEVKTEEKKPVVQAPVQPVAPSKPEAPAAPKAATVTGEAKKTEVIESIKNNVTTNKTPEKAKNEEIFTPTEPKSPLNLNIVGKIDLDALNQSTRPKKKGKEERRNERKQNGQNAQNSQNAASGGNGDRKKRRRISGKEKVDIEKTGQQAGAQQGQQGGGKNRDDRRNRNQNQSHDNKRQGGNHRQPQHTEVSDEEVSKQVKETLARLTAKDKGLKKGAKWRKEKREANATREREAMQQEMAESKVLKLTEFVTANDLAIMMDVPINQVIGTCMNIGVMVSINQRLDAETINIVAEEFGFKTEYVSAEVADAIHQEEDKEEDLVPRPPVVTVMGHVDHGKTSLLDYIRKANVIAGEAGGITQHIGAYNVKLEDGRHITFLDTPGHEAFTAMRARGAKITDLCIIIVAADDNVMPQTVEAINHASAAGVPMVFAINKIDKPHANPEKIKEELAAMNYLVEDWGGKYQSQDISAKQGIGVNDLMEKVLLEAELLDLKANPNRNAVGSIIESSLDKGRGYVATVLVQNGTLRVGDVVIAGNHHGKVKAMFNERNQRIKEAGPSTPVLI